MGTDEPGEDADADEIAQFLEEDFWRSVVDSLVESEDR